MVLERKMNVMLIPFAVMFSSLGLMVDAIADYSIAPICNKNERYLSLHYVPAGISPLFVCDQGKLVDPNLWIKQYGSTEFTKYFAASNYCYKTGGGIEYFMFNRIQQNRSDGRYSPMECRDEQCLNIIYRGLEGASIDPVRIGEKGLITSISAHIPSAIRTDCSKHYQQNHQADVFSEYISKIGYLVLKQALSKYVEVPAKELSVGQQYGYVKDDLKAIVGSVFRAGSNGLPGGKSGIFLFDGVNILSAIYAPPSPTKKKCLKDFPCPIVRLNSLVGEDKAGFLVSATVIYVTHLLDDEFQTGEEMDIVYRFNLTEKRWSEVKRFRPVKEVYQFDEAFY